MKKLVMLIISTALLLTLTGCFVASTHLEIGGGAERIELRSGDDGKAAEITDRDDIAHITENINTLRFEKVNPGRDHTGWSYGITWYGPDGEKLDELLIISGNRVWYNDTYYDSLGATIDTVFLDGLLEGE